MRPPSSALCVALLLVSLAPSGTAAQSARDGALRVYLDCRRCDFDHLRREVPVVDYVRDPSDADVHVLVTFEETGAGGDEWAFHFLGQVDLAGRADTLLYVSREVQTEDEIRDGYTRMFGLGLVRYLAYAGRADDVDLGFLDPDLGAAQPQSPSDSWNLWVFRAAVGGEFEGESRTRAAQVDGSLSASRTAEDFKVDIFFRGEYQKDEFELTDGTIVSRAHEVAGRVTAVWSFGPHWSGGVVGSVGSETRLNQRLFVRAAPALEYSLYAYAESTRRQVTALYRMGAASFRYDEVTLFDKTKETRLEESLVISADFRQPWGDLVVALEGSHFLDDLREHRIDLFTNLEVRLYRGLSLDIRGSVARVKDQIYVAREDIPPEEVFLRRRELGTEFEYSVEVGLSFTFGSVFNSIVNPRIRTGGGGGFN